jgi:tetratricopeptide (TPR) repeat protein
MRNLVQSLFLALVVYLVASLLTGSWLAGIAPALIGGGILYFVLARRSFKAFEAIANEAMAQLQTAQGDPSQVERAKETLRGALALGKDQFLITEQVNGQLGQLAYSEGRNDEARGHLEKAWSRDWMSQCTLAALDYRQKKAPEALARLEKAKSGGDAQAIFWAVYAFIAKDSGDAKLALTVLGQGVEKAGGSAALKGWQEALANQRSLDLMAFAPQWFQFFPEHVQRLTREQQILLLQAAGQPVPPQLQRPAPSAPAAPSPNRAARRAAESGKPAPSIPHPRR